MRVHVEPRADRLNPWIGPRGPGRKTRLRATRCTQGTVENRESFNDEDELQLGKGEQNVLNEERTRWTGRTIFLVDRKYYKEYGTDQRRQRNSTVQFVVSPPCVSIPENQAVSRPQVAVTVCVL